MARLACAPLLLPAALTVALALFVLPHAPSAEARVLQEESPVAEWWTGGVPDVASAVQSLGFRSRRSPGERNARQETEEMDPDNPPKKEGFWKRMWNITKQVVKKVIEVVDSAMDTMGLYTDKSQSGAGATEPERLHSDTGALQ